MSVVSLYCQQPSHQVAAAAMSAFHKPTLKLEFPKDDADFAKSLSAVVRVGDDLWFGGVEGMQAVCLRCGDGGSDKSLFTKVGKAEIGRLRKRHAMNSADSHGDRRRQLGRRPHCSRG